MSFRRLDENNKPIPRKGRTSRKPAERLDGDVTLYRYEIFFEQPDKDGKIIGHRKRLWLPDDLAAQNAEHELKHGRTVSKLTWSEAHQKWLDANKGKFSDGHANNSIVTLRMWTERFGTALTVEGTTLAQFSEWCEEVCAKGKGRGGQIRRAHLLAIARWCRGRGLVTVIPFEHAPKPEARLAKRRAAGLDEYLAIAEAMPDDMLYFWRLLGLTGMRISAACGVQEDAIADTTFQVFTKFRRYVEYPITPMVADVIAAARQFKSDHGITSDNLFTRKDGRPWTKDSFHRALKKLTKDKSLPGITSHQLRHMAGTLLAKNNYSRDIIQAGLAHDDAESATTYIDQTTEMRRVALTALEGVIKRVGFVSVSDTKTALEANSNERQQTVKTDHAHCPLCPFISLYLK